MELVSLMAAVGHRTSQFERLFSKLKNWRRAAMPYDETADFYRGIVALASVTLWLPLFHVA